MTRVPVLWRYLSLSYIKIFSLSISSFIAILLVSRFKEIARFTALSDSISKLFLFVLYQIPLILPIAIPISAFIASILLFQSLSKSFEITSFRASGVSIKALLFPLLLLSLFLSFINFALTANIAPFCKRETKNLLYHETSTNPLLLLKRQNLIKVKNNYLKIHVDESGKKASDFALVTHNPKTNRLSLLTANELKTKKEKLLGKDVSLISHFPSEESDSFDSLIIENQQKLSTDASAISSQLKKNRPRLDVGALELPLLRLRQAESIKLSKKVPTEIFRRGTLALAVFSLTILGLSFSIQVGRAPSKKPLVLSFSLCLLLMMSFFFGKELKNSPLLSFTFFIFPHLLIWILSSLRIRQISRGFA